MNKSRRARYKALREIRRERDYQTGHLQYANRPYTFPSVTIIKENGILKNKYVTTSKFIKNTGTRIPAAAKNPKETK